MTDQARVEYRVTLEHLADIVSRDMEDGDTPPIDVSRAQLSASYDQASEVLTLVVRGPVDVH